MPVICNSQHTCIVESERPSSSRSTQNVPSRISRVISRAVSNILRSSSSQQSNQASGNPPPSCTHPYNSLAGTILSRRVACEPTSPDGLLHASQLTVGATNAPGSTTSQVTNNQRSVHKGTLPNPILRANLLTTTTTTTFEDGGVTAPRVTSNYGRNPAFSTGTSTGTDPAFRNPMPTINYSRKDKTKRGTSTRSTQNSAAPSPVSGNSKAATGSSGGIISRTGLILRPTPLATNSVAKVAGVASSQSTGDSKLVNFTSDQPHPPNIIHRVSAKKSLTNISSCDLKGSYSSSILFLLFLSSFFSY
jgi:hypothetical protein